MIGTSTRGRRRTINTPQTDAARRSCLLSSFASRKINTHITNDSKWRLLSGTFSKHLTCSLTSLHEETAGPFSTYVLLFPSVFTPLFLGCEWILDYFYYPNSFLCPRPLFVGMSDEKVRGQSCRTDLVLPLSCLSVCCSLFVVYYHGNSVSVSSLKNEMF